MTLRRLAVALGLCISVGAFYACLNVADCQPAITAAPKVGEGLNTTVFQTPEGKLNVNLPEDLVAGDELTGTVIAEPAGRTKEERAAATDELNGYVVEIEQADTPVDEKLEQVAQTLPEPSYPPPPDLSKKKTGEKEPIPSKSHSAKKAAKPKCTGRPPVATAKKCDLPVYIPKSCKQVKVVLRNKTGEKVAELPVKVPPEPIADKSPVEESQGEMEKVGGPPMAEIPQIGQGGRPIPIKAPCDGKFGNSNVTVGGERCKLLAEGPRSMVARSPKNVVGNTNITFTEGDKTATCPFCNVSVKMSADKTILKKGESAQVTVTISGLKGLKTPVKLHLENKTPQIVDLSGGNSQDIAIDPSRP